MARMSHAVFVVLTGKHGTHFLIPINSACPEIGHFLRRSFPEIETSYLSHCAGKITSLLLPESVMSATSPNSAFIFTAQS